MSLASDDLTPVNAVILSDDDPREHAMLAELRASPAVDVLDTAARQRAALPASSSAGDDGLVGEPTRWAYRVDESSAPIAHSLVEDWVLEEDHGSTVVRWTFAIDPRTAFLVGKPSAGVLMGNLFRRAMRNLDRHLQATATADGVDVGA